MRNAQVSNPSRLPVLGITMGDAAGIAPEVIAKSLANAAVARSCRCVIYGDRHAFSSLLSKLGLGLSYAPVETPEEAAAGKTAVSFLDCPRSPMRHVDYGKMDDRAAANAVGYIDLATEHALSSRIDAVVTGPINKAAIQRAGFPLDGHTNYLAERSGVTDYAMMFVGGGLKIVLMTVHIALADVPKRITKSAVLEKIRLMHRHLAKWFGIESPRIAVCGLNPHAGEEGMFGREEEESLSPAIAGARAEGIAVSGPYPADTVFNRCKDGEFDAVLAMYHDQGLLPVKLLAFHEGVNITIGLPFVRTSPDHGTAFDIAGKGVAHPGSMTAAILLAAEIAGRLQRDGSSGLR
jgi:4-hydroxythreonine-4-phosphate dehydrogenase